MKITLENYGHDSRCYSGKIFNHDFNTTYHPYVLDNGYTPKSERGSEIAARIEDDWKFDKECETKHKLKRLDSNKHPWRCGYL